MNRKYILVVDDDSEQLLMIKEQLTQFYDVTLVKSGQQAKKSELVAKIIEVLG